MKKSLVIAHVAPTLLGVSAGLRSLVYAHRRDCLVSAYQDKLPLKATWAGWVSAHPVCVGLTTAAAIGEYVGDKLPNTPNRTAPIALFGRLTLGGLVGAMVATAVRRPIVGGIAIGAFRALLRERTAASTRDRA